MFNHREGGWGWGWVGVEYISFQQLIQLPAKLNKIDL